MHEWFVALHISGAHRTTLPCDDGKERPRAPLPPAPHTATDHVQTCSSLVAQEVRDSLPRNWVDVAWRTVPPEVLRNGSIYCFSSLRCEVLSDAEAS